MSTPIDWSLITQIAGFSGVIIAIVTATYKITKNITNLEARISEIERNPFLEGFRNTQVENAESLLRKAENIKEFEAKKVSKKEKAKEEKK